MCIYTKLNQVVYTEPRWHTKSGHYRLSTFHSSLPSIANKTPTYLNCPACSFPTWGRHSTFFRLRTVALDLKLPIYISVASHLAANASSKICHQSFPINIQDIFLTQNIRYLLFTNNKIICFFFLKVSSVANCMLKRCCPGSWSFRAGDGLRAGRQSLSHVQSVNLKNTLPQPNT